MDQRERVGDPLEALRMAIEYYQSRLWTALPCVVHAYPAASGLGPQLLDAQPCINGSVLTQVNGQSVRQSLLMPILPDLPILWQGGGGVTLTFPIQPGDECLVLFSARCIDAWWENGFLPPNGATPNPAMNPPDNRMHNLSDGFAMVGMRSLPKSFSPDLSTATVTTDDLQTFFRLDPAGKAVVIQANGGITLQTTGSITLQAGGEISANGVTIDPSGNVYSPGNIRATNVDLLDHLHSGVQTGGSQSGPPVPGT